LPPDHPPEALHDVALAADQLRVELAPEAIVLGAALTLTLGAAVVTVTVAACVVLPPKPLHVRV
jgi:hypothetical protein